MSMGPGRHSLRAAARAQTSASLAATGLVTPRVSSRVSKAKLKQFGNLKLESEGGESSDNNSEDQLAGEEFNSRAAVPKLESIKRKLDFGSNMDGLNFASKSVQKARTRSRPATVDDNLPEPRAGLRRRSLQSSLPIKVGLLKKEGTKSAEVNAVTVPSETLDEIMKPSAREEAESRRRKLARGVKDENKIDATLNRVFARVKLEQSREETVEVSGNQRKTKSREVLTGTSDSVKPGPRYNGVGSKRKLSSKASLFAKVAKVKMEGEAVNVKQEAATNVKQEPLEEVAQVTRKLPKKISPGTGKVIQEANGRKTSARLETVRVTPIAGAQLASEGELSTIPLSGPFPSFTRPLREECQQAKDLLSSLHGVLHDYERHRKSCPTIEDGTVENLQPLALPNSWLKKRGGGSLNEYTLDKKQDGGGMQLALVSSAEDNVPKVVVRTGHPRERGTVLDSLVGTLLSQNTTDKNSRKAFAALKSAFPTWEQVLKADSKEVEETIRSGGLAEIKAARMRNILDTLWRERGEISLEYLRSMSNGDIKLELSRFKGVGPKTVACVLMFHLQRNEFPVDTHVFRISKMLGWVPEKADREKAYLHLNERIPDSLKFDLHCLFVTHGKRCDKCAKRSKKQPMDGPCPLLNWKSKWSKLMLDTPRIHGVTNKKLRLTDS